MDVTMNDETIAVDLSASPDEADRFPHRLADLIGDMSVRAFARKAGVSDTFLRQCLAGRTEPTRTKLIAIAQAGGASVDWLVTGNGSQHNGNTAVSVGPAARLDRQLLETIIEITESVLVESDGALTPAKKAHLVTAVYDMYAGSERPSISRECIQKLVTCAT